ncbi:amidohydrolase family protein [Paraburkholderia caffeinilytica]|uniref:amidohydrolase family protein n=1 Tax=Paraburkholderia caffeinilytica TaxID=1761016 RepID=UPI0038B6B9D2
MSDLQMHLAWLELTIEEPLEPDLAICDAHHHLWDGRPTRVTPRYLLDEFLADTGSGHHIASSVYVECGTMYRLNGPPVLRAVGETEFANGMAAMSASGLYGATRVAAGIVGFVDLAQRDAAAVSLDAHLAASGGRLRGVRQVALRDDTGNFPEHRTRPPRGLLLHEDFRAGFALLAERRLVFEATCYQHQLPEVIDLARAFPSTVIVLSHCGGPTDTRLGTSRSEPAFAQWRASIAELAGCPNVVVKLGGLSLEPFGLGKHQRPRPASSKEIAAAVRCYFDYLIEQFGVERCMFESNFPVEKIDCSYTILWNAFKRIADGASPYDKAQLFHDTATRVFRLYTAAP